MDWLEEFFPFLRELDAGNGALEVAFVILVVGVLAVIGLAAMRRARRTGDEPEGDDARPR